MIKAETKARALEELKAYWLITLYLWLFLGSFTIYRRLVVAEAGGNYLHYGIALVEALVIAKVVLLGRLFGFSRRYDDRPLIVPVLYKSILFGSLVVLVGLAERVIEGWFHGQGALGGLRTLDELGAYELGARMLMLIVCFVPFFAFGEIVRVLGSREVAAMYFSRRAMPREGSHPAP